MSLSVAHRKIIERMRREYGQWDKEWTGHRENLRKVITNTRFTNQDADKIIKELEAARKAKRINQRKTRIFF